MVLELVEQFDVGESHYSLYEGERWLLFREHAASAECVGSITTSGLGYIVTSWAKPHPMVIVLTLDEAVERLVMIDAPRTTVDGETPPPLLTEVEAAEATRTRA